MSKQCALDNQQIRIGISSCLMGQHVRYDGGHKHNACITHALGPHFEFVPLCPEFAIGLGVPRAPIHLVAVGGVVCARGVDDPSVDVTEPLAAYAREIAADHGDLSGYIFKNDSPSCGIERVKVYGDGEAPARSGTGIYAGALLAALPMMPAEEEGRLMDPVLRDNFIERVFVYHRWRRLVAGGLKVASLVDFHTDHKFSILAHDEPHYRELGRLIAGAGRENLAELAPRYIALVMQVLARPATRNGHANVLMHIMGYFKSHLNAVDKAELLELIDQFRAGQAPLIVPITLLRHHLRRFPDPYLDRQYYLHPHPDELMLRNGL